MPRKFSEQFINRLIDDSKENSFEELSSILCGSSHFRIEEPDYGLPRAIFAFCEVLLWFAQSERSGSNTYFEATPSNRQLALCDALECLQAYELMQTYRRAMTCQDDEFIHHWMYENAQAVRRWLQELLVSNRAIILQLTS